MKAFLSIALAAGFLAAGFLAACTSPQPLEPIPGSLTYGGQPRTKLTKSPIGSTVPNSFVNSMGQWVQETYVIEPDRSLRLIRRTVYDDWPPDR